MHQEHPGRGRIVAGSVMMVLGVAVGIAVTVAALFVVLDHTYLRSPVRTVPGSHIMEFDAGNHRIHEGYDTDGFGVVRLLPGNVHVDGTDGNTLEIHPGPSVAPIERGDRSYAVFATFDVPVDGTYLVTIDADRQGDVLITRPLGSLAGPLVRLGVGTAVSLGLLVGGLVMLLFGISAKGRRSREALAASLASPQANWGSPAGWYPDPGGSGRARRWDGAAWSDDLR